MSDQSAEQRDAFDNPIQIIAIGGLRIAIWGDNRATPDPSFDHYSICKKLACLFWPSRQYSRALRSIKLLAGQVLGHDGRLLHPTVMPYEFYRSMSDEDLASVIVYLRSIPAIRNAPASKASHSIVATYAIPIYAPVPTPDLSTPVKRGAYLLQLGACQWCHTLRDANRKPLPGWSSQAET